MKPTVSINTLMLESSDTAHRPTKPFPNPASSLSSQPISSQAALSHAPAIASTLFLNTGTRRRSIPFLNNKNTMDSSRSNEVDIHVRNLSLSIIPEPSLLERIARSVSRRVKQQDKQPAIAFPTEKNIEDTQTACSPDLIAPGDQNLARVGTSIFRNVDLRLQPGQVCLIMGGSGSGKTTLLNALAGRMSPCQTAISGSITFNGQAPKRYWKSGQIGYLQQEDHLLPFISVRETLRFAADLRLPRSMPTSEKYNMVESLIMELGLKSCADVLVGDAHGGESDQGGRHGISGGERRRVSAAIQLLTNPSALLCDEVTSGLDSFSSFELIKTLTTYAKASRKSVVLSIHQPRAEMFKLLSESNGQIVLLSRGDVVYSGSMCQILHWFESTGINPCPVDMNPFDYILDHCMVDFTTAGTEAWRERTNGMTGGGEREPGTPISPAFTLLNRSSTANSLGSRAGKKVQESEIYVADDVVKPGAPDGLGLEDESEPLATSSAQGDNQDRLSVWQQTVILTRRGWINQRRDSVFFWVVLVVNIVLGVLDLTYVETDMVPLVYSLIIYLMAGFRSDSLSYMGWYTLISILVQFTISALALFCTSVDREFDSATMVGSFIYLPFTMTAGYIVATSQIPQGLRWIRHISFIRLGYQTLVSVEFSNNRFDCRHAVLASPPPERLTPMNKYAVWDPVRCAAWDGNMILESHLEVPVKFFPGPIALFLAHICVFLVLSWLILWSKPLNRTKAAADQSPFDYVTGAIVGLFYSKKAAEEGARRGDSGQDSQVGGENLGQTATMLEPEPGVVRESTRVEIFGQGLSPRDPVTIRIEGLSLGVTSTRWKLKPRGVVPLLKREMVTKELLKEIDFEIPAGQLTAIMGGSGAGKTTLLNTLARRTPPNLKSTGDIYFNSTRNPTLHQINTVCSYVRQGDSFLMSHLTVRETLCYAAELGMGPTLSKRERHAKVEEILDLIGLRECADVMVGSIENSGISGGQRRRVSIGMQLVIEPACLFLDEPTSGLDAVTAMSVVQTLKTVAACGRTVVCTIHQPRYDIWKEFDNVVLLLTGGRLAYAGNAEGIIGHFARAGHVVPELVNPPDFIIDTASINFRSPELEHSSRVTVEALAAGYQLAKAAQGTVPPIADTAPIGGQVPHYAGLTRATPILIRRSFTNTFRQKGRYFNRVGQPLLIVVMALIFFGRLNHSHNEVLDRLGLFQQLMNVTLASLMANIDIFPREREVAFREISNGGYSATAFLLSYTANEFPLVVLAAAVCTTFIILMTGLQATVVTVSCLWLVMLAYITTGESLGIVYSSCISHGGLGVTFMNSTVLWLTFMAGFMINKLPSVLFYLNHLSVFKYTSVVLALNEFTGLTFHCTEDMLEGTCAWKDGSQVLRFLYFRNKSLGHNIGLVVAMMVLYRLLAWVVLVARMKAHYRR
ncbi:hypothetical protein BGZ92_009204 [Podila epicladia]|nr:hypothetical protein BGZ92_009204 [Podila epicladia]